MLTPISLVSSDFLRLAKRTAAYDAVDAFLASSTYDWTNGHITLAAANEVVFCLKTNIHREPILACLADRETQLFGELLEAIEERLSDDDTRTRRMACLALAAGGDKAHEVLVNALAVMPPDRIEDLEALLRLANRIGFLS